MKYAPWVYSLGSGHRHTHISAVPVRGSIGESLHRYQEVRKDNNERNRSKFNLQVSSMFIRQKKSRIGKKVAYTKETE